MLDVPIDATEATNSDVSGGQVLGNESDRQSSLYTTIELDSETLERGAFALALARREKGDQSAIGSLSRFLIDHAPTSHAQIFQDLFALHMTNARKDGFFVEVGTGDGILISNTYLLEKEYGWRGIVVEPNPIFHAALRRNRTCRVMTECVLDVTGRTVTFDCTLEPEFSGIANEMGERPVSTSDVAGREATVSSIDLVTVSLNDLLERAEAPHQIDYLSLDVEGSELTILSTFDFSKWKIGCLTIEHNFDPRRDAIYDLLTSNGFCRVFTGLSQWDDWYVSLDVLRLRPDGAEMIPPEAILPTKERAHAFVRWAINAIESGDFDVARTLCQRAIEVDPELSEPYRTLADIAQREGRKSAAIGHWRKAISVAPADYWAHVGLAEQLIGTGNFDEGTEILERARGLSDQPDRAVELLEDIAKRR